MVQVRKLVLAIAAASALSSGMAHALGLGELSVKSTLNQPLVAEIELKDAQGLNAGQVVPSLATTADFAQAGIARQAFLNDLTFTPVINANGKSVLRITSSRAVREPYVKFLVQVLWPNGRLLREYSLLLDPPKFSPEAAAAAAATAQLPATAPTPAPAPAPVALPPAEPAPAAAGTTPPPAPPAGDVKGTQYTTGNNDTLWQIAEKVRNGGSVQQTMLAIQALNPDAFIAGNINRLKKGQVLRLPTPQQAAAMPQPKAVAEVAQQNRSWREGRRAPVAGTRQVDATRREKAGAAPSKVEPKDNLSLVSAGAKPEGKGAKGAAGDKDVGNKLAVAQESLDTARRDNAELKSRMTDLQSQVDKLQRLIQLKNDQLAKMQTPDAAAPTTPSVPATIVPAAKPVEVPAPATTAAGAAQTTAPEPEKPILVEPVAPPEAPAENSLNKLLANPVMMGLIGGGAVLLLLLLALFLVRRRKAKEEADKHKRMARALAEESDFVSDMDMELPQASFDGLDVPPPSVKMAPSAAGAPAREVPADALVQAEIHIAYGRMNQAVELLEEAIKEDPTRTDVRMKLMEIYAEQGNTKAFAAHERKMVAAGKNHAEVEQLKSRYPTMNTGTVAVAAAAAVTAAAVAAELDAKYVEELLQETPAEVAPAPLPVEPPVVAVAPAPVVAEPEPMPVVEEDALGDDFDLSLDGLDDEPEQTPVDLSLDDLLDEPAAPAVEAAKPSFESLLQQQTEAKAEADAMDDLADFDLDLGEESPELKAEDDFLLGDDALDLGIVDAEEPETHDLQLPDDFDLSLSDDVETVQASEAFASEIDDVNAELDRLSANLEHPPIAKPFESPSFTADDALSMDDEPDFDFLSGTDEAATKLDLARAYIEMEDSDGARDILDEVVAEGTASQKAEAQEMLARLA